jgi:hypothetical protein
LVYDDYGEEEGIDEDEGINEDEGIDEEEGIGEEGVGDKLELKLQRMEECVKQSKVPEPPRPQCSENIGDKLELMERLVIRSTVPKPPTPQCIS